MAAMRDAPDALFQAALRQRDELLALAWARCRDWQLADDAVQETFLVATRRWSKFDPARPLMPWLVGILRHCVLQELRRRDRHPGLGPLQERLADLAANDLASEPEPRVSALTACLADLPAAKRRLLRQYYHDQRPVREIAEELERSTNAIDLALSRLRRALRACIKRRLASGGAA